MERALELERERASQGVRLPLHRRPSSTYARSLLYAGRHEEARQIWIVAIAEAERSEDAGLPFLAYFLSALELRAGNLPVAQSYAERGLRVAAQLGQAGVEAELWCGRAHVLALRGELEEARHAAGRARALAVEMPFYVAYADGIEGFCELSGGDLVAAGQLLLKAQDLMARFDYGEPFITVTESFLPECIEALTLLGRLDEARERLAVLEGAAEVPDRPWCVAVAHRCRALLLAASGDLSDSLAEFALALAPGPQPPFELARTTLARGVVERRLKHWAEARKSIEQALRSFETLGALVWAERARDELSRVGGRPPSPDALSATEQRVAELIASGLRTKDAASAAFLSPKSVEAKLGRVYRKLGVRNRAELAALIARRGRPRDTDNAEPKFPDWTPGVASAARHRRVSDAAQAED
jgi:DNA-binding CsgD family transcriptional regulator